MDVTPEQIELAHPGWRVFEGVAGDPWYARRLRSSTTLRAANLPDLRIAVRDWERNHEPTGLHPGPGVFPRPPWATRPDRGEEGDDDARDAAAPRDPPDRRVLPHLTVKRSPGLVTASPGTPAQT